MWKLFSKNESEPAVYLRVETFHVVGNDTPEARLRYKIEVTNYIQMWCGVCDKESMIQIMLKSNKDTETEDTEAFLDVGLQMLQDPKILNQKEFTQTQNGNLSVRLLCKTPIVLRMNFTLTLCSPEQFFQSITRPLLEVINDLQNSEKKLRQHLIKKDGEIRGFMDMVPEGSPLMRCLRTEPYNDVKHMNIHSAVDKLFGTDPVEIFPEHIIQNGRPLPIRAVEPENEETLANLKLSRETKYSPISKTMKIEPTESSQSLTLQLQIPAVKSEPLNNVVKNEPLNNVVKSEPNDSVNPEKGVKDEPYDTYDPITAKYDKLRSNITIESKDDTNTSNSKDSNKNNTSLNNDSIELTNIAYGNSAIEAIDNADIQIDTKNIFTQSPGKIQVDSIKLSKIAERTIEPKLEQTNSTMKQPRSPENPEQKTPKKRRKNLNY